MRWATAERHFLIGVAADPSLGLAFNGIFYSLAGDHYTWYADSIGVTAHNFAPSAVFAGLLRWATAERHCLIGVSANPSLGLARVHYTTGGRTWENNIINNRYLYVTSLHVASWLS